MIICVWEGHNVGMDLCKIVWDKADLLCVCIKSARIVFIVIMILCSEHNI